MSRRIKKINELLKQEISSLILREFDFSRETIITITKTETSSDLEWTRVWVSVLPFSRAEMVLKILNSRSFNIQRLLDKKLKTKIVPKIRFELDESGKKMDNINRLIKRINQ